MVNTFMNRIKFFPLLLALLLSSCDSCNKNKSREKPDVSNIKADVHLQRFDKELFEINEQNFSAKQNEMKEKYGSFYNFYISQFVIGPRPEGDTANIDEPALKKFVSDAYMKRLQDSINFHFAATKDVEEELSQSLKHFKYYFPNATIPQVVSINSGFALGAFTYDKDVLGIGLDMYLGANNPDYDSAGIYKYVQHKMSREYIARNSMEVLYNFYFGGEELSHGKNLIEAITEKGKKIYFLSYMLPDAPDSLLVGFTDRQTRWCENSEYEIWKFMNDKDLLYKDNYMDQKRYLDEGPTTPGMPEDAPGNIGSWIGLQIVRKFAKETGGKISLRDLMLKYDAKTILAKAKYRPAKSVF